MSLTEPSAELLRSVNNKLIRTKLTKCSGCGKEVSFSDNPSKSWRRRFNLCDRCFDLRQEKRLQKSINQTLNSLTRLKLFCTDVEILDLVRELEERLDRNKIKKYID